MKHKETSFSIAFCRWFDFAHKAIGCPDKRLLKHVPNEGNGPRRGAILKAMGVRAGTPDYELSMARHGFHGLYLEFKTPTGSLRPEQREFHAILKEQGYEVKVCRTLDEAMQAVQDYLKP